MIDSLQLQIQQQEVARAQKRKMSWVPNEVWDAESLKLKAELISYFLERNKVEIAEPIEVMDLLLWLEENNFTDLYQQTLERVVNPDSYNSPITHLATLIKYATTLTNLEFNKRLTIADETIKLLVNYSKLSGKENLKLLTTLFWNFVYQDISDEDTNMLKDQKVKGSRFIDVDAYISTQQTNFNKFAQNIGEYIFNINPTEAQLEAVKNLSVPAKGIYVGEIIAKYYQLKDLYLEANPEQKMERPKIEVVPDYDGDELITIAKMTPVLNEERSYMFYRGSSIRWEYIKQLSNQIKVLRRTSIINRAQEVNVEMGHLIAEQFNLDILRINNQFAEGSLSATELTGYYRKISQMIIELYNDQILSLRSYGDVVVQLNWHLHSFPAATSAAAKPAIDLWYLENSKFYEIA